MSIANELTIFLESTMKKGENKSRDISIIKYYYGLAESFWPTLEETAIKFDVGTRERIRQILNSKFKNVTKNFFPSLNDFIKILCSKEFWLVSEFTETIQQAGLIEKSSSLKGIFNLIEDFDKDSEFEFYTPELKPATRSSFENSENLFLIKKNSISSIRKLYKKAQNLQGRCGIANLKNLKKDLVEYYSLISQLIQSSPQTWIREDGDDFWYIYEDRENTITNYSKKVFSVIDYCDATRLANTYRNALDGRSVTHSKYPPSIIIEEYLKSSAQMKNTHRGVAFLGETTKLNDIEEKLLSFFDNNENASFTELKGYLLQSGYEQAYVIKSINNSPLIHIDKTHGRKHHLYSHINKSTLVQNHAEYTDNYEYYQKKLRGLIDVGTDEPTKQIGRKEQSILRDWLFKNKNYENCAICGKEFYSDTLVAAHKKPRSECNDEERLDPYIVMPICLMGCDYLYEKMFIYIEEGEIKRGQNFIYARAEVDFIEKLVGRKIDSKWLLGDKSYFRSPS